MDLVKTNQQGDNITTSLIVAQVFGKRNSDVLRDIRNLHCSAEFRERNFALMVEMNELPQGGAQKSEYYEMTKDGFSFLVMGYTGQKAGEFKENFITEFNKREALLKSDDYILMRSQQILTKRVEAQEATIKQLTAQAEQQQAQIEADAPRVRFSQAVETADKSILIGELAKILRQNGVEMGERRLFEWMRKNGYLCSHGERYNQPTQRAMEMGLFELKKTTINKPDGTVLVTTTTKVTGKGQIYFVDKFLRSAA